MSRIQSTHSRHPGFARQAVPLCIVYALGGLLLGLIAAIQVFRAAIAYFGGHMEFPTWDSLQIAAVVWTSINGFGVLIAAVLGLRFLGVAAMLLLQTRQKNRLPGPLDQQQVVHSLLAGVLSPPGQPAAFRNHWLARRLHFQQLPPTLTGYSWQGSDHGYTLGYIPHILSVAAARQFRRWAMLLFLLILVLVAIKFPYERIIPSLPSAALDWLLAIRALALPNSLIAYLCLLITIAALTHFLIFREPEPLEVAYETQELTSPKQPQMVFEVMEDVARAIERDRIANRVVKLPIRHQERNGVGESCEFSRAMFLEQSPRIMDTQHGRVALGLAIAAMTIVASALMLIVFHHPQPETAWSATAFKFLAAAVLCRGGLGILRIASLLRLYLRFESLAIWLEVQGQISRAKVTVGNGRFDSIKSENETNRTDLLITFRAARVCSETDHFSGQRLLVHMSVDEEIDRELRHFQNALAQRVTRGIDIAGLNWESPEVANIMQVTSAMKQAQRALSSKATRPTRSPHFLPSPTPESPMHSAEPAASRPAPDVVAMRSQIYATVRKLALDQQVQNHPDLALEYRKALAYLKKSEQFLVKGDHDSAIRAYRKIRSITDQIEAAAGSSC